MFESDYFSTPAQPRRRAETNLSLDKGNGHSVIERFTNTADTLHLFATPTSRERIVEEVQLNTPESSTQLPKRYNLLTYMNAELYGGDTYKTKITLPGRTLVLEGTRPDGSGAWHTFKGTAEEAILDHADIITYLSPLLPHTEHLDELAENAEISDAVINEALWQDIKASSRIWSDASYYENTEDSYVAPPLELITTRQAAPTENDLDRAAYLSSVSSVIGIKNTPTKKEYTLRIGTEAPIVVDSTPLTNDIDEPVDIYSERLFRDNNANSKRDITITDLHKEYHLSVERSPHTELIVRSLATLALESDGLTSKGLELLTLSTALDSQNNLAATYEHAINIIRNKYPELTQFGL